MEGRVEEMWRRVRGMSKGREGEIDTDHHVETTDHGQEISETLRGCEAEGIEEEDEI